MIPNASALRVRRLAHGRMSSAPAQPTSPQDKPSPSVGLNTTILSCDGTGWVRLNALA